MYLSIKVSLFCYFIIQLPENEVAKFSSATLATTTPQTHTHPLSLSHTLAKREREREF